MNVGFGEIVMLLIVALLIFGPEKLPEVAENVGKTIARFRREASSTLDELKRSADLDEIRGVAKDLRSQTDDLKKSVALTGPVASSARPADRKPSGPTPFDPDAT